MFIFQNLNFLHKWIRVIYFVCICSLIVKGPEVGKEVRKDSDIIDETDMSTTYGSFRKRNLSKRWSKKGNNLTVIISFCKKRTAVETVFSGPHFACKLNTSSFYVNFVSFDQNGHYL